MGFAFGDVDLCRFDGAALPSMHEFAYDVVDGARSRQRGPIRMIVPGGGVLQGAAGLPGWHGSLRDGPLLGA